MRFARILAGLAADLAEEGDEAAVVGHRPAVERMIVALRALDAGAEERLRGVLRELQRIDFQLVVVRRGIIEVRAGGGDELARHLVDGHIFFELLADPGVVGEDRLVARRHVVVRAADLEEFAPFHRPDVHEFLFREEHVHGLRALLGVLVGVECLDVIGRRQRAGDVNVRAAQERFVVAQRARENAQLVELRIHELVHVVPLLALRLRVLERSSG